MAQATVAVEPGEYREFAREQLEGALFVLDSGADLEILGAIELALMAVHCWCGDTGTVAVTLDLDDVDDLITRPEPECICPPDLLERGGFRGGCPDHGAWPGGDA